MSHSNTVHDVQVRERDHDDIVEALDDGETVGKQAVVNDVALTANCAEKLVFLNLTGEHGINIKDKEPACVKITFRSTSFLSSAILLVFSNCVLLFHRITDSVEIPLVNRVGTSDF